MVELVAGKTREQVCFSHPRLPDQDDCGRKEKFHWTAPATSTGCMGIACCLMTPDRLQRLGSCVGLIPGVVTPSANGGPCGSPAVLPSAGVVPELFRGIMATALWAARAG